MKWIRMLAAGMAAGALTLACSDHTTVPSSNSTPQPAAMSPVVVQGGGPTGALFTTMPDGGVVNANVKYPDKLWVYIDGGPGPNAPQTAAGLDDGNYVFQVTDPSGQFLLSRDPARCRVVEVKDGIIIRTVPATELGGTTDHWTDGKNDTRACHITDAPDGVFGPSGQHDINTDADHGGAGAIVVQLMPFGTTPNPGGVYKAWVTPVGAYAAKGGDLNAMPKAATGKAAQPCPDDCYQPDKGFGPPRNLQKTDNFKVKEVPPRLIVKKFHDVNANGIQDSNEADTTGWGIKVTETLFDGSTITNDLYTTVDRAVSPNSKVTVCEATPDGWYQSALSLDGTAKAVSSCIDVTFAAGDMQHTVVFGNFKQATKSGHKFHDLNANGKWDTGEPTLDGWTIKLTGTNGLGQTVDKTTTTDANGKYEFSVDPGTYTVTEVCTSGWLQSAPAPSAKSACDGKYVVTLTSGQAETGNDFGNYKLGKKSGTKFFDRDGNGTGDKALAGWTITLLDGAGTVLRTTTTDAYGAYAFDGLMPGTYIVCEAGGGGWYQTSPTTGDLVDCTKYGTAYSKYGYKFTLTSGQVHSGNDFCNTANCVGLTPGYWVNWSNHYSDAQFLSLLQGTIAQGSITTANAYLTSVGCDNGDAFACMRRFLLSTQLTLNLTGSPSLPNPSGGDLKAACQANGDAHDLGYWLAEALKIYNANGAGYDRDYILTVKNWLDTYANLRQIVYTP